MTGKRKFVISICCLVLSILLFLIAACAYMFHTYTDTEKHKTGEPMVTNSSESELNASSSQTPAPSTITTTAAPTQAPSQSPSPVPTPTPHPDRQTLAEGFYAEPLPDDIINKITDVSFHPNNNITFDDLRYLNVLYVDFNNQTQVGELICNKAIAKDFLDIFKALYDAQYKIEKIRLVDEYGADDDLSCADNNTSCFNYREVAGSNSLSKHALGLAIDINPFYNPYITYPNGIEKISPPGSEPYKNRDLDDERLIKKGDICYNLFTSHGFTWGGEWKSLKDYQHFQKVVD